MKATTGTHAPKQLVYEAAALFSCVREALQLEEQGLNIGDAAQAS